MITPLQFIARHNTAGTLRELLRKVEDHAHRGGVSRTG